MKRAALVLLSTALAILLLTGCDLNAGKRPSDCEGAIWTAKEIEMSFSVSESNYEECGANTYGWITVDGSTQAVFLAFDYGDTAYVMPKSAYVTEIRDGKETSYVLGDDYLFSGVWKMENDKNTFTLSVLENRDFLPEEITEITFIREDLE